jgi:chromosome segregation ATPase
MQDGPLSDQPLVIFSPVARDNALVSELMRICPSGEHVTDIETAQARLRAASTARLVLLCPRPEAWVALALGEGTVPSQAVADWRMMLRNVVTALRKDRRRTTVLFDHFLARSPDICARALGLEWGDHPAPDLPETDPLLAVIAREALLRDDAAHSIAAELEAAAFVPEGSEPFFEIDPDLAFAGYKANLLQRDDALHAAKAREREANDRKAVAMDEARRLQIELQAASEMASQAKDEAALLRDEVGLQTSALLETRAALALKDSAVHDLQAEADTLRSRLHAAETRIAQATERETATTDEARRLQIALDAATTETAAARAEADLLRDQIRLEGAALENLQSEADTLRSRLQAAETRIAQATERETATTDEARRLQIALDAAKTETAAARAEADLLRDQIRLESAAWQEARAALEVQITANRALQDEAQRLTANLHAAQIQLRKTAEGEKSATAEVVRLKSALEQATEALSQSTAEAALLRDQVRLEADLLHETRAALETQEAGATDLKAQVHALQAKLRSVEAQATDLTAREAEATKKAARLQGELEATTKRIEEITKTGTIRDRKLATVAVAAAEAEAEAVLLRDQIRLESAALQETRAALALQSDTAREAQAAYDKLQVQTNRQREEAETQLRRVQDEAQTVIRQLRDQLYRMGQGLESYHVQLDAMQIERQELLAQIRQLHEIREDLECYFDRASDLSAQVDALGAETTRLQTELGAGQAELLEHRQHTEWLQGEVQRIYKSRSYRMMSPLRRVRVALQDTR